MADEVEIHRNKRADKAYISPSILTGNTEGLPQRRFRIASKVIDSPTHHEFVREVGEHLIRVTDGGRQEVIVKFYEDDRTIFGITLQRFTLETGTPHKHAFSFVGEEITRFIEFLLNVCRVKLPTPNKLNVSDEAFRRMLPSPDRLADLIRDNQEHLLAWARSEVTTSDIVALGYRRKQLERFRRLLSAPEYFDSERETEHTSAEGLWQKFFEKNKWIFGYGLTYFFLSNLKGRGLEQVIAGADAWGEGKRADAALKTRGAVEALCLVEVKRHDTALLKQVSSPYRSGCWSPSDHLTGGIVQSQATAERLIRQLSEKYEP